MVTPAARWQGVAHLCASFEVSQRRACEVIGADRSSVRYLSLRPDDATIRIRLRELASVRRRFGYRRLLLMIRSEGLLINHKKLRRLMPRSGCRFAGEADAKEPWEHGLRWCCRRDRTSAGHWNSSATR
jgi:hypothetical protein